MNEAKLKFLDGVKLFNEDLYWDSIEAFQESLSDGLEDRYVDDCFLNIAICCMQLNLFNEAKDNFLKAIDATKNSEDRIDFEGPLLGKTSDRAKLGFIRVSLANKDIAVAEILLKELESSESFVEIDDKKVSMYELAVSELKLAKEKYL